MSAGPDLAAAGGGRAAEPGHGSRPALRLMAVLAGLYVAQAVPLYLFSAAVPAVLRDLGVSRSAIGLLSVLALPWILKFLWAPLIDRHVPLPRLGRRRAWILPLQVAVVVLLFLLAQIAPAEHLHALVALGLVVAVLSATQDIATDGFAVERLAPSQRGIGNAIQGGSVAIGVLVGSAGTLLLYERIGWAGAVSAIALIALLAALPIWLMREPDLPAPAEAAGPEARPSLRQFWQRADARAALAFCLLYRSSEGLVKGMEQPFLVDSGLSLSAVGLISGASAATVGLAGSLLAAFVIRAAGLRACLWGLGIARTICFAGFALYAGLHWGGPAMLIGIAFLNTVIRYMEIVGLYSLYMGISSLRQAATDFTLLSCAQLLVYMLGAMLSGVIADAVGYANLFTLATFLSAAGIWLSMRQLPASHPAYRAA